MNAVEIEEAISTLAELPFDVDEFPYAWSCHASVPVSQLTYAAFRSNAKGLFPPSDE